MSRKKKNWLLVAGTFTWIIFMTAMSSRNKYIFYQSFFMCLASGILTGIAALIFVTVAEHKIGKESNSELTVKASFRRVFSKFAQELKEDF